MSAISRDKIAGAIYGTALGDAVGRDTEFTYDVRKIYRQYGRDGYMPLPRPALFTDDTQMTIAVARALGTARDLTPRDLVGTLTREFIRWARTDERRAPGVTCLTAIRELHRGVRWQDATVAKSKGCGANMRVAPVALIGDSTLVAGVAQLQGALTHGHPTAIAASELTALAVRWAALGVPPRDLPRQLFEHAHERRESYEDRWLGKLNTRRWPQLRLDMRRGWDECIKSLLATEGALRQVGFTGDPCNLLGGGWVAEEALATALYCAARHADDPLAAVSRGARTSGDSDSIASIAGAIVGAYRGQGAWPTTWTDRIERRGDLENVVDTVYQLA